ncbi:hypothetical protein IMSAGC018_00368 [Lachnospiraceae bacterium]|nr:hypothetical protein IMSAGC018_00368 [Lachnospiraceae bacterium]
MIRQKWAGIQLYYKELSLPFKASLWFFICNILQKGFSLISTPVFVRLMSSAQYGKCMTYYSWYELLYVFATLNMSSVSYNNILVKYPDDQSKTTLSLMSLSGFTTIFLFMIYICSFGFWNQTFRITTPMMCVMFLQFFFEPAFMFWAVRERYSYSYKKLTAVTLSMSALTLVAGVCSVMIFPQKYEARVASGVFISVVVGIVIYAKLVKEAGLQYITKYWKFALKISVPLIPHYLAMKILNQADRVMISRMVGESETAIYSLAYTLSMIMTMLTNAINNTLVPFTYKGIKSGDCKSVRKTVNMMIVLVLVFCSFMMLTGPELIKIFATKEYLDAIWIIPPISLSVFFMFGYVIFSTVEFYYEKTSFAVAASGMAAVINVILNYIFIKSYGYYAAGYTTVLGYILLMAAHYVFFAGIVKKHPEIKGIYNIRLIFWVSAAGIGVMLLSLFLYRYIMIRYMTMVIIFAAIVCARGKIISLVKNMRR